MALDGRVSWGRIWVGSGGRGLRGCGAQVTSIRDISGLVHTGHAGVLVLPRAMPRASLGALQSPE